MSGFHTGKVTDMSYMFLNCSGLTSLDLSSFDMSGVTFMKNMFGGCSGLSTIYTPYNIPIDTASVLPAEENDKWYDSEQKTYTELPTGLDYSIILAKNKTPDATEKRLSVILSKYVYEKGSVIQPEDLTVQYRGTDGKTICVFIKDDNNVSGYTMSGADTDTPGDITVKVGKATLTYGADYTLSYRNNTQAGKTKVIVTGAGDLYAGSKEATFQINGESIAKAQITGIVDKTYTGAAQTQEIQVQLNGKTLKNEDDYTVSYAKEVNVGTAIVTVTGKGGYTGSVKKSFKITAYDLQTDEAHKLDGIPVNPRAAYTKGGATPELALTFDGRPLTVKKDYTVTYKNNKKLGGATGDKAPVMIVNGKGNFKGTLTIPFAITVNNLETDNKVTITAVDTAYVNKAGKYAVTPVLTDVNGKKLAAGTDYEKTLTYMLLNADGTETELTTADIAPAGSIVKVTVMGKGSYTGSISATYRITEASFSKAKITIQPKAYTGGRIMLSEEDIKVTLGGKTLTYGEDYTFVESSYKNNVKKGSATVIVKGLNNYGGSKTVKFKITTRTLTKFLIFNLFGK